MNIDNIASIYGAVNKNFNLEYLENNETMQTHIRILHCFIITSVHDTIII